MFQARRRRFLVGTGAAFVASFAWARQKGASYRVGVMLSGPEAGMSEFLDALRKRLARDGFVDGQNLRMDVRVAIFDPTSDRATVRTLAASQPDAIFSFTSNLTRMVQEEAGSISNVFTFVGDAVSYGLVKSYARPGGNSTGTSWHQLEMIVKRLEYLRELLPHAKRMIFAGWLLDVSYVAIEKSIRATMARLGFEPNFAAFEERGIVGAVESAGLHGAEPVFVAQPISVTGLTDQVKALIKIATIERAPVCFPEAEYVSLGGTLSYGPSFVGEVNRAADLLARVLRGEKPANLPVELASRYELTVNAKSAKALGIEIPQSILLRADQVIR